jgi:hypothetical protein
VLHLWQDELSHLNEQESEELAREFIKVKQTPFKPRQNLR